MAWGLSEYELVKDRITFYYQRFETGRIVTSIHSESDNHVTIKASLFANRDDQIANAPLATGYAREESGGAIDKYTENGETSAIGRALANADIYGALAKETGTRPSREEMSTVKNGGTNSGIPQSTQRKPETRIEKPRSNNPNQVEGAEFFSCTNKANFGCTESGSEYELNLHDCVSRFGQYKGENVIACWNKTAEINEQTGKPSYCNWEMPVEDWDREVSRKVAENG